MIAAIVPAAGQSQRMGRPKLILPIQGQTVIARVVTALRQGGAAPVVVVAPPLEAPGAAELVRQAEDAGGEAIIPKLRPLDMRSSVELALDRLKAAAILPTTVLITPADTPGISPRLVARVIEVSRSCPDAIVVPCNGDRRGHPLALPWTLAREIPALAANLGVNALLRIHAEATVKVEIEDTGVLSDLDTPEDYMHWITKSPNDS